MKELNRLHCVYVYRRNVKQIKLFIAHVQHSMDHVMHFQSLFLPYLQTLFCMTRNDLYMFIGLN